MIKEVKLIKRKGENKKVEQDMSMSVYRNSSNTRNMISAHNKTSGSARKELRSVTPYYKVTLPSYKSKMWDSKKNYSNSGEYKNENLSEDKIEKYLIKSDQLYARAKIKEINIDQSKNIIGLNPEEEIGDMLIDSILYKVNVLQNI